jgi:uncharacterized membrane protein (DUF485 family)
MTVEPTFYTALSKLAAAIYSGWCLTFSVSFVLLLIAACARVGHLTRSARVVPVCSNILEVFWCSPLLLWCVQSSIETILTMSTSHPDGYQLQRHTFAMTYSLVFLLAIQCLILMLGFGYSALRRLRADTLSWSYVLGILAIASDIGVIVYVFFRSHS